MKCAEKLKNEQIHFLFIGAGAEKEKLLSLKEELGLDNVTMLSPVTKLLVKEYITILDVGLVNLKKSPTFKSVIPSKIFELAAMNIPVLLGVEGESKEIINNYKIGYSFEPENEVDFIEKLHLILNCTPPEESFIQMLRNFNRKILARNMLDFIKCRF